MRRVLPFLQLDASDLSGLAEQVGEMVPRDCRYWLRKDKASLAQLDSEQEEYKEWSELANLVCDSVGNDLAAVRHLAQGVADQSA